jgi:hypothetical protein
MAGAIGDLLQEANQRDAKAVANAMVEVKDALEQDIEGSVVLGFGGSVRKHTYVDGLSDVDLLVVLRDPELRTKSPQQVLDYFEQRLRVDCPDWTLRRGTLSITLLKAGLEIQVLPAIRAGDRTRIPSSTGDRWSAIDPQAFTKKLTDTNARNGQKVVPVIKKAKIINARQPERLQLTGYHLESMAIEAFKEYRGPMNPKAMLEHFIERARSLVLAPIKDRTGQSVHVDDYLGPANSPDRKAVASAVDRVFRRMKNADVARSMEQWLDILGEV